MFYYIYFVRPPPLQAQLSGNVFITPQIANDLRTALLEGSHDIFYSWLPVNPPSVAASAPPETTIKTGKLTTWRQANAYKEIPVPPPPGVREGQRWRLVLMPSASLDAHGGHCSLPPTATIPLDDDNDSGRMPFAVVSMPILFTSCVSMKGMKQDRIERVYRLCAPSANNKSNQDLSIRLVEQTSFDLDKKVWDGGVGLSSWLIELHRPAARSEFGELRDKLFGMGSRDILELGAGIGVVGIVWATLRSTSNSQEDNKDCIMITDLPSAIPLLEENILASKHLFTNIHVEAAVLDWDKPLPGFIEQFPQGFDAIIMSDVAYNTTSFPSLVRTVLQLVKIGAKQPLILLGYKERDPAERIIWAHMKEVGLDFVRIGEKRGAGGMPVEIWLGSLVRKN